MTKRVLALICLSFALGSCSEKYSIIKELEDKEVKILLERDSSYADFIKGMEFIRPLFSSDPILKAEYSDYYYSDLLAYSVFVNDSSLSFDCAQEAKRKVDSINGDKLTLVKPLIDSVRTYYRDHNPKNLIEADWTSLSHTEGRGNLELTKHTVRVKVSVNLKVDNAVHWSGFFTVWEYDRTEDKWKKTYIDKIYVSGGKSKYSIDNDDEFINEQSVLPRESSVKIYSLYYPPYEEDHIREDLALKLAVDNIYNINQFKKKYEARFEPLSILFLSGEEFVTNDFPFIFKNDTGDPWSDEQYIAAGNVVYTTKDKKYILTNMDMVRIKNELKQKRMREFDPRGYKLTQLLIDQAEKGGLQLFLESLKD